MEYQLQIFAKRTARVIKSRPKFLLIPILALLPLFYYLFAVTGKTLSYEETNVEHFTDIYDDGVWYQALTTEKVGSERTFSEKQISISIDGEDKIINSQSVNLQTVFTENNIQIGEFDKVEPNLYSPVFNGMSAKVIRVTKAWDEVEEVILRNTEYTENAEKLLGTETIIQEGSDGKRLKVFEKEFEDGKLVSSVIIENRVLEEPVTKIIEKGTKIVVLDTQYGVASYYFHRRYPGELIAAHPYYKMQSKVKVTDLENGKSVIVTVVDRGPNQTVHPDRVIDLSTTAFRQIASTRQGTAQVKVELLGN